METRKKCSDHARYGSIRRPKREPATTQKEQANGHVCGDMDAISEGLMIHPIRISESPETGDLTCPSHDHTKRYRNQIQAFPDGGAFDLVVECGAWKAKSTSR
jgi:hypothetical protein